MPFAPINGIQLYFEIHGDGPSTIVFAHGAGGNHMSWWQQVPYFSKSYQCITFDHRMFAQSADTTGEGYSAFVKDLEGLLEHLGIDQLFLVSQSMGGRTCMPFTMAHPERVKGLVMADNIGGIGEPVLVSLANEWRDQQSVGSMPRVIGGFSPDFPDRNPAGAFLYQQITGLNPPRPDAPSRVPGEGILANDLAKLKVPVLFIVGQDDPLAPPHVVREAHKLIPKSRLEVVPGAGHSVYFEKPEEFNRLVDDFFDEIAGRLVNSPSVRSVI